jgi:hypothetical protein
MPEGVANPLIGLGGFALGGIAAPQIIYTVIDRDNEPLPKTGELTGIQGSIFAATGSAFPGAYGGYGFGGIGPFGGSELTSTKGPFGAGEYGAPGFASGLGVGYLGFGTGWPGTYANYRLLLQHPTVQLARSIVFGSILIGSWNYEEEEGCPKEISDWYMRYFPRLRQRFLSSALRALDYGWFPFEPIWEIDGDMICLKDLKPLQIDFHKILIDLKGNFAGLRQLPVSLGYVDQPATMKSNNKGYQPYDLAPNQCHIYSYDSESGRLYGRSRLENVRRTVADWYTTNDHVERLSRKATGFIFKLTVPPGGPNVNSRNPATGQPWTWLDRGNQFAAQVTAGTGTGYIVVENMIGINLKGDGTGMMRAQAIDQLSKTSLWGMDTLDLGDNGPMLHELTNQCSYKDKLIFRGYLCPERSGMQGEHGTQEDAGQHTDTGSATINATHDSLVANFNELAQKNLVWNFGEKYRHAITAKAVHVNDIQESIDRMVIQGVLGNKDIAPVLMSEYDLGEVLHRRGIPKRSTPIIIPTQNTTTDDPPTPTNGNGKHPQTGRISTK